MLHEIPEAAALVAGKSFLEDLVPAEDRSGLRRERCAGRRGR